MTRRTELTSFIERYAAEHGQQSPSLQEIAAGLAISKTTTNWHVNKLIAEGRAIRQDNKFWLVKKPFWQGVNDRSLTNVRLFKTE